MDQIVLSEQEIIGACQRIGSQLTERLSKEDKVPVFIGVMKGSMNFMMDLTKQVKLPIYLDYIQVSSYSGSSSTGKVSLKKDFSFNCEGRVVVIIEDIVDTGISMNYLINHIKETHKPKEIIVVTLFDKVCARKIPVQVDYAGAILNDNKFIVGYGLDYNEFERQVPYVYILDEEKRAQFDEISKK